MKLRKLASRILRVTGGILTATSAALVVIIIVQESLEQAARGRHENI